MTPMPIEKKAWLIGEQRLDPLHKPNSRVEPMNTHQACI
jgi:hypothetical protein